GHAVRRAGRPPGDITRTRALAATAIHSGPGFADHTYRAVRHLLPSRRLRGACRGARGRRIFAAHIAAAYRGRVSVVRRAALRRWSAVAGGVAALCLLPVLIGLWPAPATRLDPAVLRARILDS